MQHLSKIHFGKKKAHLANVLLMLAGMIIFMIATTLIYQHWKHYQSLTAKVQTAKSASANAHPKRNVPVLTEVQKEAFKNIEYLFNYPWQQYFIALEKTHMQEISLLSLEPNIMTGQLKLSAEADDIHAMFTYIKSLQSQKNVNAVMLINQSTSSENEPLKVAFELDIRVKQHE